MQLITLSLGSSCWFRPRPGSLPLLGVFLKVDELPADYFPAENGPSGWVLVNLGDFSFADSTRNTSNWAVENWNNNVSKSIHGKHASCTSRQTDVIRIVKQTFHGSASHLTEPSSASPQMVLHANWLSGPGDNRKTRSAKKKALI
jgi:hypothetical protein